MLTMPAEIDVANAREAEEELNSLLARRPGPLVVDLSQTRFCDSAGMATLVRAWKRSRVLEVPFRVAAPSEPVLHVMQVLGASSLLDIYPSLEAALPAEATGTRSPSQ